MPTPRDHLINKLRELGFSFRKECDRTSMWRRSSDGVRVFVPRNAEVKDENVTAILDQCGLTTDEIKRFLGHSRC